MTCLRALPLLPLLLLGCHPEIEEYGEVCFSVEEVDGEHRVTAEANSGDCASDHKGASLECELTLDGSQVHAQTVFQDGKDPNDACAEAIFTSCGEVAVEPGTYTVEFGGESYPIEVPGGEPVCIIGQ